MLGSKWFKCAALFTLALFLVYPIGAMTPSGPAIASGIGSSDSPVIPHWFGRGIPPGYHDIVPPVAPVTPAENRSPGFGREVLDFWTVVVVFATVMVGLELLCPDRVDCGSKWDSWVL